MEALDRITDDNYGADDADDADNPNDKEPDVSGGSVPGSLKSTGTATKTTGARKTSP